MLTSADVENEAGVVPGTQYVLNKLELLYNDYY